MLTHNNKKVIRTKLERAIDKAIRHMGTVKDHEKYLALKIDALSAECCCVRCYPQTWTQIKDYCDTKVDDPDIYCIYVEKNNERFTIESTDGGPEFVIYLEEINNLDNLLNMMLDVIRIYVKNRPIERMFSMCKEYRIRKIFKDNGEEKNELIHTFLYPLNEESIKEIYDILKNTIKEEIDKKVLNRA